MKVVIKLPSKVYITAVIALFAAVLGFNHLLAQPQSAAPATTGAQKIAVVDLVRIFNECAQILDLNDMIRQKNEDYSKEANQRRKVIEDKQLELGAFKPGSADYETRKKNLIRMNIESNVWLKVAEQEVDQLKFDWTRIVYDKAMLAVSEIAKERSCDLVIQKMEFKPFEIDQSVQNLRRVIQDRTAVFYTNEIDLTESVIQRMNSAYKSAGGRATLMATSRPAGP